MKKILHSFAVLCALGVAQAGAQDQLGSAPGTTAPPSLLAPRRIILPCQGPRGAVAEFEVALPNRRDTNATIECHPPSGSMFPVGTNTVTCLATDAAGSQLSTAFPVIVVGGCAVDDCIELDVPEDIQAQSTTSGGATVEFKVTASERCTGGPVTVACVPSTGSLFPVGPTRVVCTAQSGDKRASASFLVEVNDDRPPEIQCPTNLVVEALSPLGAMAHYEVTGKDDSAAQVRVRCSPPSGSVFPVGDTRVFCRAADGNGNSSSCAFMVKVNPAQPLRVTKLVSNQVELRWTGDASIEATDALGEDSPWQEITNAPRFDGVERMLQLPASARQTFFRTRPMPLLPPADRDGDHVPDHLDNCPDTPHGLAVDEHGCAVLELVATPDTVLGPEREALAKTLGEIRLAGNFSNLMERIETQLTPSNSPAPFLRSRELAGAFQAQSNLVFELRRAVLEFPREMGLRIVELEQRANPLDAAHGDVRPEDFEILRLGEIGTGLTNGLSQAERTLTALSNLVQATSVRHAAERVRITSFDNQLGTAQLEDGRLLLLPGTLSEAAPPVGQIPGVRDLGSSMELEASPLPDGSWLGFGTQPEIAVSPDLTLGLDPTCLRLRIVPADPAPANFAFGPRHHPRGYLWGYTEGTSRYYLEVGMGLAVEKVNCATEAPGDYLHWLDIRCDDDNNGYFSTLDSHMDEESPAAILKRSDFPKSTPFPMLVREFRRRRSPIGPPELLKEQTYIIEINDWGLYAQAEYSRTIFEIEDSPNETAYQPAQVTDLDRQWPLILQPLAQQTFTAQSFKLAIQGGSSYPDLYDIHLNELFAVHVQDPNEQGLFAYAKDMGRGLYEPTVSGFNHARPFTYRVTLPGLVRDRLHHCFEGAPDSYYRIPFHGPLGNNKYGTWHVSQGNSGSFTHTNKGRYAFDFPAKLGTPVLAARGGIVIQTWESSYKSCWDPDIDNGKGKPDGACTNCYCEKSANFVSLRHQDGTIGVYYHFQFNGIVVTPGQRVFRGDTIGYVGNTGCSTGPHLHLEVRKPDGSETIPIRFECWNDEAKFRGCYLPPHDSDGFSTNKPWWWPF